MIQALSEVRFRVWFDELIEKARSAESESGLMTLLKESVGEIGFEKCAYGLRVPSSSGEPEIRMDNNYPDRWVEEYAANGFVFKDPTVINGMRSTFPMIWNDELFQSTPDLWEGAKSFGLRHGWSQSYHMKSGAAGLITFVRSHDTLTQEELRVRSPYLIYLSHIIHDRIERLNLDLITSKVAELTLREKEILKWTADGKTSAAIASTMNLSTNTVNFHLKNAIKKLDASNKVSAVARAIMLKLIV